MTAKRTTLSSVMGWTGWICLALLALTVVVCWVRSYYKSDDFNRTWDTAWVEAHPFDPTKTVVHEVFGNWTATVSLGSVGIYWATNEFVYEPQFLVPPPHVLQVRWSWTSEPPRLVYNDAVKWSEFLGFKYHGEVFPLSSSWLGMDQYPVALEEGSRFTELVIPNWAMSAITFVPFLIPLPGIVRRRRRARGLCSVCSYDLRAHAVGERCPECGAVSPDKSADI